MMNDPFVPTRRRLHCIARELEAELPEPINCPSSEVSEVGINFAKGEGTISCEGCNAAEIADALMTIVMVEAVLWDVASKENYRFGLTKALGVLDRPATAETIDTVIQLVAREWVTANYAGDTDSAEKLYRVRRALEGVWVDLVGESGYAS